MEMGYIAVPFALEWIPFGKKLRLIYKKDAVMDSEWIIPSLTRKRSILNFCRKCKKLVIDLEEKAEKL